MFDNFYLVFIIGFFSGIGFFSLFFFLRKENKIEVGSWFNSPPINLEKNLVNANSLFLESVNLSCHWSLRDHEIEHIKRCINNFFEK